MYKPFLVRLVVFCFALVTASGLFAAQRARPKQRSTHYKSTRYKSTNAGSHKARHATKFKPAKVHRGKLRRMTTRARRKL